MNPQASVNDQTVNYSEKDLQIAIRRIQQKRNQNFNNNLHNASILLSPIRRYFQNPQTFPQWAVKFLVENRNELAKQIAIELNGGGIHQISSNELIKHILNSYVYPYVANNLSFNMPNNSRLERGDHRSALDIFVDEALWEVCNDLKKHYAIYDGKYYCIKPTNNKYKESLADTKGYGLGSRTLWILLEQEGLAFSNGQNTLGTLMSKIKTTLENRFKYQLEESNENSKKPNQIFNDLGYYLYKSTSIKPLNDRTVSPRDTESNKKVIDEIIFAFSGIDYQSEHEMQLVFIPKFEGLALLREQLKVHMQNLYQAGIYNHDLETHLFAPDKPISQNTNPKNFFSSIKSLFQQDQTPTQSVAIEVENLYKIIQYIYELYQIGTTLYNSGTHQDQKFQGEILIEIAMLYAERIDEISVEVEAKLKVNKFEVRKLNHYLNNLTWFISGRNYTKVNSLAAQLS